MLPIAAISFQWAATGFYFSRANGATAVICSLGPSRTGLLWLTGKEANQPENLPDRPDGYLVCDYALEVDQSSFVSEDKAIRPGSLLLQSEGSSIRVESGSGATRIYTISGKAFDDKLPFAAYERWQAVVYDHHHGRSVIYSAGGE